MKTTKCRSDIHSNLTFEVWKSIFCPLQEDSRGHFFIATFVQRKLRAVSHQTYTFYHFFKWRYCQEFRKKGLFCCWHLFCSRYDAEEDGDFDHLILEHSFLSSFSFCVVDSWLSFSHDRRSPSTEVSLSLTVFVGRNQDFERRRELFKIQDSEQTAAWTSLSENSFLASWVASGLLNLQY